MLDYGEYITEVERYQDDSDGYHNGYDQLEGNWLTYYKIARYFIHKVKREDREDFLHDLMLEMAKVKAKYEPIGKPLTEAGLMRVASYELTEYWVKQRKLTSGLDCNHCSTKQRRKCREENLYSKCPQLIQLVSLSTVVGDGDGHKAELIDFLADDKAIDLDLKLDARRCLLGMPRKVVKAAYKKYSGQSLTHNERNHLTNYKRKHRKPLL